MKTLKRMTGMIVIAALCLSSMSGCSGSKVSTIITLPKLASEGQEQTEKLADKVDVYWDATPSMAGYLGLNGNSRISVSDEIRSIYKSVVPETTFVKASQDIDVVTAINWAGAERNYYRFDAGIAKYFKRSVWSDAIMLGSFYDKAYYEDDSTKDTVSMERYFGNNSKDSLKYTENYLTEVFDYIDPDSLSIVVTDMYELADDIGSLYEAIGNKIMNSDMVVSMIGVQSEFAGTIYDLSAQEDKVSYGVDSFINDPTLSGVRYHPFYIFICGDEYNVELFTESMMDELEEEVQPEDGLQSMMFYSENQVSSIDNYAMVSDELDISPGSAVYATGIAFQAEEGAMLPSNFQAYEISRSEYNEESVITQTYQVKDEQLKEYLDQADESGIALQEVEAAIYSGDEFAETTVRSGTVELSDVSWDDMSSELTIKLKLSGVSSLQRELYRFRVHITYPASKQEMPEWVKEWTLDKSGLSGWLADNSTFPGTKTNNLSEMVQLLLNKTEPDSNYQEIACLDYYIQIAD